LTVFNFCAILLFEIGESISERKSFSTRSKASLRFAISPVFHFSTKFDNHYIKTV